MNGVAIVDNELLTNLIAKIENVEKLFKEVSQELKDAKKPYMTAQEVMDFTGFSRDWITDHKHDIGCSVRSGQLKFRRKDVEEFMEEGYHKVRKRK